MRKDEFGRLPALAALLTSFVVGVAQADREEAEAARPVVADLRISFKLDPRLTRAQYMGDRWVSMRTFTSTVQAGTTCSVDVAARGVDARGMPLNVVPEWSSADPGTVAVTPLRGTNVGISGLRPGETSLEVTAEGVTKKLFIKVTALYEGTAMQMEISQ